MKKTHFISNLLAISVLLLLSCEKQPGEGGDSSIKGMVYIIDYANANDNIIDTFPATDEDVYLVYGDSGQYDDDVKTNYDGTFQFDYLREGDYQIFMYARDWQSENVEQPIVKDISISSSGSTSNAGTFYLYKAKTGTGTVKGKILVNDVNTELQTKDKFYIGDIDVYIQKEGATMYFEKIATNFDGSYEFSELYSGTYIVFAYDEIPDSEELIAVKKVVVIEEYNQVITLSDIEVLR